MTGEGVKSVVFYSLLFIFCRSHQYEIDLIAAQMMLTTLQYLMGAQTKDLALP